MLVFFVHVCWICVKFVYPLMFGKHCQIRGFQNAGKCILLVRNWKEIFLLNPPLHPPPRVNTFIRFLIIISIIIIIIIIQGNGSYSFPLPSAEMEKGRKLWCSLKLMIGSVIVCVNGSHWSKSQKLSNSFLSFYLRFWVYYENILRT